MLIVSTRWLPCPRGDGVITGGRPDVLTANLVAGGPRTRPARCRGGGRRPPVLCRVRDDLPHPELDATIRRPCSSPLPIGAALIVIQAVRRDEIAITSAALVSIAVVAELSTSHVRASVLGTIGTEESALILLGALRSPGRSVGSCRTRAGRAVGWAVVSGAALSSSHRSPAVSQPGPVPASSP